jgi:ABC-type transport system substrate-binding protein
MRNYTGYCNPEVDKPIDQQSAELDRSSSIRVERPARSLMSKGS